MNFSDVLLGVLVVLAVFGGVHDALILRRRRRRAGQKFDRYCHRSDPPPRA